MAIKFKQDNLDCYMKAWHSFIGAKLMLVTHFSDVTEDRVVLLYTTQTGKSINIGNVIQRSIFQCK